MDNDNNVHVRFLFFTSLFLFLTASISAQNNNTKHEECSQPYSCGQYSIYYPFWGGIRPNYCASNDQLKLQCEGNQNTTIQLGSQSFQVLHFDDPVHYTLTMVRTGLIYDHCSSSALTNTSFNSSLFRYSQNVTNITIFYGCPSSVFANRNYSFPCKEDHNMSAFYGDPETARVQDCEGPRIEVQVSKEPVLGEGIEGLNKALSEGFRVHLISEAQVQQCLECVVSNGTCGANDESQFTCFCQDGTEGIYDWRGAEIFKVLDFFKGDQQLVASEFEIYFPDSGNKWNWERKVGIGVSAAVLGAIVVSIGFYICSRQKKKKNLHAVSSSVQSKETSYSSSIEDTEKGCTYFGVHFFTYSELEEATNFFDPARELGDGGFGTVYFGKLHDGRVVAVKRMYENSYRRVEQFVNEVEILTGLHHQNLVSLRRHEINLSNMAIKKIQSGALHEIVDTTLGFETDFKVRKMISAVAELAFQCLQSSKDVRPSMAEVLDRLEDIRSDGSHRSKHEVLDISEDDAALLKNVPPPPSPDSHLVTISNSTPPNDSQ
ncbi:hypothetical protein JHK85_021346 [Glycine max]|nr:hypothetical protein JHK85_021346 [Glycine max]